MGSVIQIIGSESSADSAIESLLFEQGLESMVGSRELADAICKNKSTALVEQLSEYAHRYPSSRSVIVEALDLAGECECAKVIRSAKRSVSVILALNMIEALSSN